MKIDIGDKDGEFYKVYSCARCDKDHYVNFFEFKGKPINVNGIDKEYWGLCPNTKEPILMHIDK